MNGSRIGIAHAHHPARGGAERVAEQLARLFDAPLYSGHVREAGEPEDPDFELVDLFGDRPVGGPVISKEYPMCHIFRDAYYMWAWERCQELTEHDVLIESGNNPGWFVPKQGQAVLRYVHSTPRNPYDLFHTQEQGIFGRLYCKFSRSLYQQNLSYPDVYVANSELVADRMHKFWGIDKDRIEVCYPPVDTESFGREHARETEEPYFLTLGRLFSNKRLMDVVDCFAEHQKDTRLIIAGSGPERDKLEKWSTDNIEFTGYVSEQRKRELMAGAEAFVFNASAEDFGMAPIEAMASGTPVLGVRDGYTEYQVKDGKNGILFHRGVPGLWDAIEEFKRDGVEWSAERIEEYAEQFNVTRFNRRMRELVQLAESRRVIDADEYGVDVPEPEPAIADGGEE